MIKHRIAAGLIGLAMLAIALGLSAALSPQVML